MSRRTYKDTHSIASARRGLSAVKVPITERVKIDGHTHDRVLHIATAELELWIDYDGLFRALGADAVRAKSGFAKVAGGLVRVKAVNIKRGVA